MTELELGQQLTLYKAMADNAEVVIGAKDTSGRYIFVNPQYEVLFNIPADEFLGKTDEELFPADIAAQFRQFDQQAIDQGGPIRIEEQAWVGGELRSFITTKFPVYDSDDVLSGVGLIATDITELKALQSRLTKQSETDVLVPCLNRRRFFELVDEEVLASQRHHRALSFIMFDVDHFKQVNDSYGHLVGDEVLIQIVEGCNKLKRDDDMLGRIGGEEFALLLPQTSADAALALAERLRQHIASIRIAAMPEEQVTISLAVTELTPEIESSKDLMMVADKALYRVKASGRNGVELTD